LFRIKLSGPFQEVEAEVPIFQKLLTEKFRFIEVVPHEGRSTFASDVVSTAETMTRQEDGFPTLAQVFVDKIKERLLVAKSSENYEHWELVRKIGLAALGQGRNDDED